jgi:6-phosphogluconolactonase (cycloisomerase 2 family)
VATRVRCISIVLLLPSFIVLAGCGSGNHSTICPLSNNALGCGCGPTSTACQSPEYLYATGLNSQVSAFPVDPSTGKLGSPTSTSSPNLSLGMAVIDNQFLYVSNPEIMSGGAIDAWSIDLNSGKLTAVPGSPFSTGIFSVANGLVADDVGPFLYVADAGRIDGFKADATGALSALPGSPFPSGTNLYLATDPGAKFIFSSVDDPPGGVFAFTIDSTTGALTAVPGSPFPVIPNFTGNAQPGAIIVDLSGKFVFTTLATTNQVAGFSIDSTTGALTPVPGSPFTAGKGPLALAATVGEFLFVSNALDGNLSGYNVDPTTGMLTPMAGSPFPVRAAALTTNNAGNFLYASQPDGMAVYDVSSNGPTQVGNTIPFAGATVLTFVP